MLNKIKGNILLKIVAAKRHGLDVYQIVANDSIIVGQFFSREMATTRMEIIIKSGVGIRQ